MRFGLIGEKLGHSFSKEIHEKLGRYEYELCELPPEELEGFIRRGQYQGLNVTIPYKTAVIPFLDFVSDRARNAGAVNTIVRRVGKLFGDNTDCGGLELLLKTAGIDPAGKKVLIAGTGGTSLTAAAVAKEMGASEICRLSRSEREGALTYEEAYRVHADADVLINTTPAGMYPDVDGMAVDIGRLPKLSGVADVVYNPLRTRLVLEAEKRGIPAVNGLYMLVAQAVLAAEQFTGGRIDECEIGKICRELLFEKSNLVLIGMPGSGKSTVGGILSDKLGREFLDTDREIERAAGMAISEIFARYGEPHFRDLETAAVRKASKTGGKIIATGGGAVLRQENRDALRQNGILVFLDRPLSDLVPTDDRPTADDRAKMRSLFEARYPVYQKASDLTVDGRTGPEDAADEIIRRVR